MQSSTGLFACQNVRSLQALQARVLPSSAASASSPLKLQPAALLTMLDVACMGKMRHRPLHVTEQGTSAVLTEFIKPYLDAWYNLKTARVRWGAEAHSGLQMPGSSSAALSHPCHCLAYSDDQTVTHSGRRSCLCQCPGLSQCPSQLCIICTQPANVGLNTLRNPEAV